MFNVGSEHRLPLRPNAKYLKPASDHEASATRSAAIPAWKKISNPTKNNDHVENTPQEIKSDPSQTGTATKETPCGSKAQVKTSRCEACFLFLTSVSVCEFWNSSIVYL